MAQEENQTIAAIALEEINEPTNFEVTSDSSFNIELDFRFDTNGFFDDPVRRNTLEAATEIWESLIQEDFPEVPAGVEFTITNPQNGAETPLVTLTEPIDDLLIFVGAQSPPFGDSITKASGGSTGKDAKGDIFKARVSKNFRGTGPVTNFEPWAGNISFEPSLSFSNGTSAEWFFDTTPETADDIPNSSSEDFLSTALHEIGHVKSPTVGLARAPSNSEEGRLFLS